MPAIDAVEPRIDSEISSPETTNRLVSLVLGDGLKVSEAHRVVRDGKDGGVPVRLTYGQAATIVRRAKVEARAGDRSGDVAGRILRLLSVELAALEAQTGPKDLDRLQRIAQTLATVDRLSPQRKRKRQDQTPLLDLIQSDGEEEASDGDV